MLSCKDYSMRRPVQVGVVQSRLNHSIIQELKKRMNWMACHRNLSVTLMIICRLQVHFLTLSLSHRITWHDIQITLVKTIIYILISVNCEKTNIRTSIRFPLHDWQSKTKSIECETYSNTCTFMHYTPRWDFACIFSGLLTDLLYINSNFSYSVVALWVVVSVTMIIVCLCASEVKKSLKVKSCRVSQNSQKLCVVVQHFNVCVSVYIWDILWQSMKHMNSVVVSYFIVRHQPVSYKWAAHWYSTFLLFSDPSTTTSEAFPEGKERPHRYCQPIFASCCTDNDYSVEKHQTSRAEEAQKLKLLTLTESQTFSSCWF